MCDDNSWDIVIADDKTQLLMVPTMERSTGKVAAGTTGLGLILLQLSALAFLLLCWPHSQTDSPFSYDGNIAPPFTLILWERARTTLPDAATEI